MAQQYNPYLSFGQGSAIGFPPCSFQWLQQHPGSESMSRNSSNSGSIHSSWSTTSLSMSENTIMTNSWPDVSPIKNEAFPCDPSSPGGFQQNPEDAYYNGTSSSSPQQSWNQNNVSTDPPRHTPTSLAWTERRLLDLYDFIVIRGREPHFELKESLVPNFQTPQTVYLDQALPHRKGTQKTHPCMWPWGCTGKTILFNRPADLERHYLNVHASAEHKERHACDYPKCSRNRSGIPFTRKDHYRDHLRDYHKEDIGCAKKDKKEKGKGHATWERAQEVFLKERRIVPEEWRCAKCLYRNHISVDGWSCRTCKGICEQDRIAARGPIVKKETGYDAMNIEIGAQYSNISDPTPPCVTCGGNQWFDEAYNNWVCQTCPLWYS